MDIATLVEKIQRHEIDLQPDFQRGHVWTEAKQKRLIDTILRGWYVPAVHIVVNDDLDREEVLDGQQRLRAIIDFMTGKFTVDGSLEPEDNLIRSLDGLKYHQMPDQIRSRFRRFTLNTVRLREYRPEEPGELFFRLNQLTALTAAEQRNALVGEPRNQIRHLSDELDYRLKGKSIGFSNARMNFDDTLSRLAVTLELGSIGAKVTANILEKRYRAGTGFPQEIVGRVSSAIGMLSDILLNERIYVRLNRASLFSWLFFFADNTDLLDQRWHRFSSEFFIGFEGARNANTVVAMIIEGDLPQPYYDIIGSPSAAESLTIFNDRASSRVNDVSSVLLRDMCLNVCLYRTAPDEIAMGRLGRLRRSALESITRRLSEMPKEPSERLLAEGSLAKQWEARREAR